MKPVDLLRRLTNGVYVVGAAHDGRSGAFTAAWITQASFDPLLLTLSVDPTHATWPILDASRAFTVSILAHGQLELARAFGTRSGRDGDKLSAARTHRNAEGVPFLAAALAHIDCRVVSSMPAGDHVVVVAEVIGGAVHDPGARPLQYSETGGLDGSAALFPPSFAR